MINQLEGLLIAKAIRNLEDVPLGYKETFMRAMLPIFRERIPFFDEKRFKSVILDTFPEGWPNRTDKKK